MATELQAPDFFSALHYSMHLWVALEGVSLGHREAPRLEAA